eukprot:GHVP01046617.1.p1 GENE.GHVP01046617.1~~GHVP01046617.1.p1  ORF type:complete len:340 (+),score=54.52 GHVP01046617.1:1184-2203(+)
MNIIISFFIDWKIYGRPQFPPLNFIKFNLGDPGTHFGYNSKIIFIVGTCLVAPMLTLAPFFIVGIISEAKKFASRSLSDGFKVAMKVCPIYTIAVVSAVISILLLSLPSHLEIRFIVGVYPILLIHASREFSKNRRFVHFWPVIILPQVVAMVFLFYFHKTDVWEINKYLHEQATPGTTVFFFICYDHPGYNLLHGLDLKVGFFDCSPPLRTFGPTELDLLAEDPASLLERTFCDCEAEDSQFDIYRTEAPMRFTEKCELLPPTIRKGKFPDILVVREEFTERIEEWLEAKNYILDTKLPSGMFETSHGNLTQIQIDIFRKKVLSGESLESESEEPALT